MPYSTLPRTSSPTYIFSWLLQKTEGNALFSKPCLTIIQNCQTYAEAEREARKMAQDGAPGFKLIDCVAVELA